MPRAKHKASEKTSKAITEKPVKKTAGKSNAAAKIGYLKSLKSVGKRIPRKAGIVLLVLLALILAVVRYRYLIVPITVNGKPILISAYVTKLQRLAGMEVTNQLITQSLINQKAEEQGVSISSDEINTEIERIKQQFKIENDDDLNTMLAQQGMTKSDLNEQIELNLKVQKLLADKIQVSEQEINDDYDKNKKMYNELTEEQAKNQIKTDLKTQKMQQEIRIWLQELRTNSKINVYLPGINVK